MQLFTELAAVSKIDKIQFESNSQHACIADIDIA